MIRIGVAYPRYGTDKLMILVSERGATVELLLETPGSIIEASERVAGLVKRFKPGRLVVDDVALGDALYRALRERFPEICIRETWPPEVRLLANALTRNSGVLS